MELTAEVLITNFEELEAIKARSQNMGISVEVSDAIAEQNSTREANRYLPMTNIPEPITVLIRNSIVHQWYVSKSESDKRILKLLAGLSLSLICYVGMWMPLNNYVDTQQRQAYLAQSTADWLVANRMALEAVATPLNPETQIQAAISPPFLRSRTARQVENYTESTSTRSGWERKRGPRTAII